MEDHIIWFRKGRGWKWNYEIRRTSRSSWTTHDKDTAERFGSWQNRMCWTCLKRERHVTIGWAV